MKDPANTFEALYRAHSPGVFRRARRMLGNDADAQEIVNEVFLSLYRRPDQYRAKSALSTFLYAMTTNACLNVIRSKKRRARALGKEALVADDLMPRPVAPDRMVQVRRLLEKMPEALSQVAVYYFMDELTHEEISELLGCSRRHVGNLLIRLGEWCAAQAEGVPS